tara:strand:+ start:1799 stop:5134 length:3336 start_codon:yes stop_codon:yes gene_type:complete
MNKKQIVNSLSYTGDTSSDISTKLLNSIKIGENSGKIASGTNNVFIGYESGYQSQTNDYCVFIGSHSGHKSSKGDFNTLVGSYTGTNMENGSYNTISGYLSGSNIENGSYNTLFGYKTGVNNTNGDYNCIFGVCSGLNIVESQRNIIIGTENGNIIEKGDSNILIGNKIETLDIENHKSIIIGNDSKAREKAIIIGNDNICDTENNISIGNDIITNSKSIFIDPLNQYDSLILQNGIDRINLKNIIANPINNNLIYKPLENIIKNSKENNVTKINLNHSIERYKTDYINTEIKQIKNTIQENENDIIYIFNRNFISIGNYSNKITLPYKIFVKTLPKYGYVSKLIYEKNEEIFIYEYEGFELIKYDEIELSIIEYDSFISRKSSIIPLKRNSYNISNNIDTLYSLTNIVQLYNGHIYNENGIYKIRRENKQILYENDQVIFENIVNVKNLTNIKIEYEGQIKINDIPIQIIKLEGYDILTEYENLYIMFKSIINPLEIEHNLFFDDYDLLYIEIPPQYGYIKQGNIIENINTIKYITKEFKNDQITIRLIKNNKLSLQSYVIQIYNYIYPSFSILNYSIYNNILPTQPYNYILPNTFIEQGYILNDIYIEHPNKEILSQIIKKEEIIHYSHEIILQDNILIINLVAFGDINLEDKIYEKIENLTEINHIMISVLSKPKYGYIQDNIYYNTENIEDDFRIMVSTSIYDGYNDNIVNVIIKIENNFELTYSDQYIYTNTDSLKTIFTNDIYLTSNHISQLSTDIIIEEGIYDYIVTFGQKNIIIDDISPKIRINVYKDKYVSEIELGNNIYNNNEIIYQFENDINEDYKINLVINPIILFDIEINEFIIRIFIGNKEIIIKKNELEINTIKHQINIEFNKDNKLIFEKDKITINQIELNIGLGIFNEFRIKYILNENNIDRLKTYKYDLINYHVKLIIKNLEILTTNYNENSYNLNIGKNIVTLGINNICIGKEFNTFGNNSIILGNNIGIGDSNLEIDSGLHESIIIGNNSFKNALAKNIITIGNNILNDMNIVTQDDYINVSNFFSRNPILIGNNINYNNTDIINIGNCFIEQEEKIKIGKENKQIVFEGQINIIEELKYRIKKIEEILYK